jgi:hypothetical protein
MRGLWIYLPDIQPIIEESLVQGHPLGYSKENIRSQFGVREPQGPLL